MTTASKLENTITPSVIALGFEVVECKMVNESGRAVVRVLIDSEKGVSLEDCQRVSEQISAVIDVEAPLSGRYHLEVSSPGLDRPLVKLEHYQRFIGKNVRIKLHRPLEGRRNFAGELVAVIGNIIQIQMEGKTVDLPLDNIEKSNVVPDLRF